MKVIVTGILGQDGANMVEYLLKNTEAKIFGESGIGEQNTNDQQHEEVPLAFGVVLAVVEPADFGEVMQRPEVSIGQKKGFKRKIIGQHRRDEH